MTTRDDVIEQAQHFHDAPKDCVVEYAPDSYVVTVTAEQAVALRAALAKAAQEKAAEPTVEHDEGGVLPAGQLAVNDTGEDEPVVPVKRGPGRPRKVQD